MSLVYAKEYALSIGINNNGLTGAKLDAQKMKAFLQEHHNVSVILLDNENATKERILSNMKHLIKNLEEGDRFYFFYSGHGTNSFDPVNSNKPTVKAMLKDTGALIPWGLDSDNYAQGLIISKRDLVPFFKELEKNKIETIVMIDACFSGGSYKSYTGTNLKNISFFYKTRSKEALYPYEYITYISASTRSDYTAESANEGRGYFSIDLIGCFKKSNRLQELRNCLKGSSLPTVLLPKTGDRKLF